MKFLKSKIDPCLFKRHHKDGTLHIIVYVDDILESRNEKEIEEVIQELNKKYEIKDLGKITHHLGINIIKNENRDYLLNQVNKTEELVKKFNLQDSKPYSTPMEVGYLRNDNEDNLLPNNKKFRQAVGSLLCIAMVTRPDIMYVTSIITSKRNKKPRQ